MKKQATCVRLAQIDQIIKDRYEDPYFNVDELVEKSGLSKPYVYEVLFIHRRATPQRLIEEMRLKRAAALLDMGRTDLQIVSNECGYSRYGTFRRAFKKVLGINPSQYISRQLGEADKNQEPGLPQP
ncbi:AraC family transcriptional regulator [bacterium]|nr:AraC family transcriptional regulator [bacterium]